MAFVVAAFAACVTLDQSIPLMGQQQPCPDPERRKQAVRLSREINTAQLYSMKNKQGFQPLRAFPQIVVPVGLTVHLVSTASEYAFSVKDERSSCRFTVFSDQEGVIYTGQPLQCRHDQSM
jgi:hypothetical protein